MGSIGGPPEEIGHKVGAALVGTFLGILLCYGFLAPLAANMTKIAEAEGAYYNVLRVGVIAYVKGNAPILCAEICAARRSPIWCGRRSRSSRRPARAVRPAITMADEKLAPSSSSRRRRATRGHHGGAWKVAYADFVTAMMAFFMVMWLMSSSEKVQQAVGAYFRDPTGSGKKTGSTMTGAGQGLELAKDDLGKLKDQINSAMKQMPQFDQLKDNVAMTVTGEGLRIELLETEKGLFFESGSMKPSEQGEELLVLLAKQLGELPNRLLIEGHTDAKQFKTEDGYGNWELSVDRANAARKLMQATGVRPDQIMQVRGFADQQLRVAGDPNNASNRRISVIVQYLDAKPAAAPAPAPPEPAAAH